MCPAVVDCPLVNGGVLNLGSYSLAHFAQQIVGFIQSRNQEFSSDYVFSLLPFFQFILFFLALCLPFPYSLLSGVNSVTCC